MIIKGMEEVKKCGTDKKGCGKELPFSSFNKSKSGKYGLHPLCKDCRKADAKGKAKTARPPDDSIHKCGKCGKDKEAIEFASSGSTKNGLQSKCKTCSAKTQAEYKDTLDGYITKMYNDCKNNADRSKETVKEFKITKDDLIKMYKKQEGKCILTGMDMKTDKGYDISIDRIDPKKGYVKSNVQLVIGMVNVGKAGMTNDQFIRQCYDIVRCRLQKID